jgi:transcriptional regulator with GAF, ATPase, and Fis domain
MPVEATSLESPVTAAPSLSRGAPSFAQPQAELWRLAALHHEVASFLAAAAAVVLPAAGGTYCCFTAAAGGRWVAVGEAGARTPLPTELLADALDADRALARQGWCAAPLSTRSPTGDVLAVHAASALAARQAEAAVAALAPIAGQALSAVRARADERRRTTRLEAILEIASRWNATPEMEPLLTQMAEAARRLLGADRASIFLWDRANHTLVGRPALGVEGGELRIADNAGIVGQVIQTGQARRVDAIAGDQQSIDRQVDVQLGYQTRTLLCVPLRGRNGDLFGAFEVINKLDGNFTDDDQTALIELAAHAATALENTQERADLLRTRRQIADQAASGVRLIGQSPVMEVLRSTIGRLAQTDLAVLVLGENGTGKEVVSQSIHYQSNRRDQPFIAVNCAAISETLLESELFGHEKGAFTDAHAARQGKFELANGGTLFLDEIGDLSAGGQAKLLRVLEEKVVVRVGGSTPIHTDARVIAATNQNLAEMVRQKKFRQDLFFRLNVVTLDLPPLRDRPEDIMLLAEHFLADFCKKARRRVAKISTEARRKLEGHTWPGNVRELRNLMERLAYLSQGDRIEAEDLAFILTSAGETPAWVAADLPLAEATDTFQTEYIKKAVARAKNNMSDAAKRLGLHRSNLYRKMRQLGMSVDATEE